MEAGKQRKKSRLKALADILVGFCFGGGDTHFSNQTKENHGHDSYISVLRLNSVVITLQLV